MKLKLLSHLNIFIAVVLLTVLTPSFAWSAAELHPSLSLRLEYDDNILLRTTNEVGDYRMIVQPGLSFTREKSGNSFAIQYSSNLIYHYDYSEQDTFSHSLAVLGETDPSKKISAAIDVTDTYRFFLRDPRQTGQPLLVGSLAEGNTLIAAPSLRFRVGSNSRIIFGYQYTDIFYKNFPAGRDREEHKGTLSWEQEFGTDIVLTLGYGYSNMKFDQPLSEQFVGAGGYDDQSGQVGLHWRVSSDVSWDANYSYVWREYEGGDTTDFANWDLQLNLALFEATSLQVGYSQAYNNDVQGRNYKNQLSSISLIQDIGKRVVLNLGTSYGETTYQSLDRDVDTLNGNVGVRVEISSKLSLLLNGSYQDWNSSSSDVSRDVYTVDGTLAYQVLDWLFLDARYRYLESISNTSTSEYAVNRYSIAARATF